MVEISTRPHVLYRFFGPGRVLLYVGITADPGARWTSHSHHRPWCMDPLARFQVRWEHQHGKRTDSELASSLATFVGR